jgi:hypothetical protein
VCGGSEELAGAGRFVPNGVASAEPNPLGNGPVLLLGLGQLLLDTESLVALLVNRILSASEHHDAGPGYPSPVSRAFSLAIFRIDIAS